VSECINRDLGALLYGYEINILSDQQVEQFELHLLECEHCHNELKSFEREAALLSSDIEIKTLADRYARGHSRSLSVVGKIWQYLWPDVPFPFKPALAYLLIVLLIIPAYLGLKGPAVAPVREYQQVIHLSSTRAVTPVLTKSTSDNALLTFRCEGCRQGEVYRLVIRSQDGATIYANDRFAGFDEREIGNLSLAISKMDPAEYLILVSDPSAGASLPTQEFRFWIEE
jgi:hypothetical protein